MADDDVNDRMVAIESKYCKVEEIDRKLRYRLNKEVDRNVGASQVVLAPDKKEELDREQRKKNIIIN